MTVGPETIARVERIMSAEGQSFTELAKLAGLNPATDFRFKDLRGVDLSDLDLRAFDFAGSDLSYADLTGSQFADAALFDCRLVGAVFSRVVIGGVKLRPEDLPDLATFKEAEFAPEMVVIPGGTFLMGSPEDEPGRLHNEGPQHEVTVPRFALGACAVTFAEYDHFCETTEREKPEDKGWGRDERPAIYVSWKDASAYCEWLSGETGCEYRLPSEAEWEYACRASSVGPFWWGDTIAPEQANYDGTFRYNGGEKGEFRQQTVSVRSFARNPFGLWQVHGNVWEWCADNWRDDYEGAPSDGRAWLGGGDRLKVLRGGSWSNYPGYLRSTYRGYGGPGVHYVDFSFRVARTLTP